MYIGSKNDGNKYYLPGNNTRIRLSEVNEDNDLGLWVYLSLIKCEKQSRAAVGKALSALGQIKLSFQYLTNKSFSILYKTYVRVHL